MAETIIINATGTETSPPAIYDDAKWCPQGESAACLTHITSLMAAICYLTCAFNMWRLAVPGRLAQKIRWYIIVLLLNLWLSATIFHLGTTTAAFAYRAACGWSLGQACLWSIYGLYLPYWTWPGTLIIAYLFQLMPWPRPEGDFVAAVVLLELALGSLWYQEWIGRRRYIQWTLFQLGVAALVFFYLVLGNAAMIIVGQFGYGFIHFTQSVLLLHWHFFWIQQEQDWI